MRNPFLWLLPACALVSQSGCLPSPPARPDAGMDVDAGSDAGTPDTEDLPIVSCPPSSSSLTNSMRVARREHSSTLLKDGRVLVAGGSAHGIESGAGIQDAETYDPATGTWTVTGSMLVARTYHAAVRLLDGRVLVTGGRSNYRPQNTAELYDPATSTWSAAASMVDTRVKHQSLLLSDGRVLVSGGTRVELYDPATNTWRTHPQLEKPYQAALLPDGRVLLLGASDSPTQLYDPTTDTVSSTGSPRPQLNPGLLTARPDGRVMLLSLGGDTPPQRPVIADLYDPATGVWSPLPESNGRYTSFLRFSDDGLLLTGGFVRYYIHIKATYYVCTLHVELYDPVMDRWCQAAPMQQQRTSPAMTRLLTGQYLITGRAANNCEVTGYERDQATAEIYTPPQGW